MKPRDPYHISIRGKAPEDLVQRISAFHAQAILLSAAVDGSPVARRSDAEAPSGDAPPPDDTRRRSRKG